MKKLITYARAAARISSYVARVARVSWSAGYAAARQARQAGAPLTLAQNVAVQRAAALQEIRRIEVELHAEMIRVQMEAFSRIARPYGGRS